MTEGRVKTLVLPYPMEAAQFDPLIVAATVNGVTIEFVAGVAAAKLAEVGGIGAYLYYAVN